MRRSDYARAICFGLSFSGVLAAMGALVMRLLVALFQIELALKLMQ